METINLKDIQKIHFVGIGGIGISGLARMMLHSGKTISGTNDYESPETLKTLTDKGVPIMVEHESASHIEDDTELIIYSTAWDNNYPEFMEQVNGMGIPVLTYPQALGLVSKEYKTVAITGTHGKTSVTAMLGHVLHEAGKNPHVIVGSIMKDGTNYMAGDSDILVVEACEFNRSFHNYYPDILAILNIEPDHLNYYKDLDEIIEAFAVFAGQVEANGVIIGDLFDQNVHRAVEEAPAKKEQIEEPHQNIRIQTPGRHNLLNAQFVIQLAEHLGVKEKDSIKYLATYPGVWRRSEKIGGHESGALIYDDYAHHPTEIRATLAGFKETFPDKNIRVVFEPHLYSRTKQLFEGFTESFGYADEVIFAPIYPAREPHDPTIAPHMLADGVSELDSDKKVRSFETFADIEEYLDESLTEDDLLLTMGAGDVFHIANNLVKKDHE